MALVFYYTPTGTAGANDWFQIEQIMLNEGPAPAQFQTAGANIQQELAMCQRYAQVVGQGWVNYAGNADFAGSFVGSMRIVPTAKGVSGSPVTVTFNNIGVGSGTCTWTNGNFTSLSTTGGILRCTAFAGTFGGNLNVVTGNFWLMEAEL
jgi:hypothetical protein